MLDYLRQGNHARTQPLVGAIPISALIKIDFPSMDQVVNYAHRMLPRHDSNQLNTAGIQTSRDEPAMEFPEPHGREYALFCCGPPTAAGSASPARPASAGRPRRFGRSPLEAAQARNDTGCFGEGAYDSSSLMSFHRRGPSEDSGQVDVVARARDLG